MSDDTAVVLPTFDQLWADAVRRHHLHLPTLEGDLSSCKSVEDVISILVSDKSAMKAFREKGEKIRGFIAPFVNLVRIFVGSGGEAASATGVPGGKAVFSVFSVLLAATKGVSQVYDALEQLLSKLQGFLGRLDTYLASPTIISPAFSAILVNILAQLLEVLALCTKRFDQKVHTFRKFVPKRAEDYVKVLLGDSKVQKALDKLDKLTNEEQQRAIAEILVATKLAVDNVQNIREELCSTGITKWLSPPNPEDRHQTASKSRQSETGEWFFQFQFTEWTKTENGIYWIHGKPGSGKSVLFSSIVDKLQPEQMLVYFYFDFRDPAKQTARGLVLSLVYQLASRSRDCFGILKKLHAEHRASLGPPNDEKLVDCLRTMLRTSGRVYMLIDALDECPEDKRYKELLPFLKSIVAMNHKGLRLLVTSRPEDDVRKCMASMVIEELSLHNSYEQTAALARHITDKLENVEDYCSWSDELRSQAKEGLIANAGGMFLWADLQLERLRRCHPHVVRTALNTLPKTLYGTYERILEDIDDDNAPLAHRVFQCIAFAARPLTPEELTEALCLSLEENDTYSNSKTDRVADPESWLLRTCSGLVEIVQERLVDRKVVQFVHFSAQEYLLSDQLPGQVSRFSFTSMSARTMLAKLCFVSLQTMSSDPVHSFAGYAISNWMAHIQSHDIQKAIGGLLSDFLHPHSSSFTRWLELWVSTDRQWYREGRPYDRHSTPLYVAAHLGLEDFVRALLDIPGVVVNVPLVSVLWASAIAESLEITRLLLKHGADVNARMESGQTPLHAAAQHGHVEIALLLLGRGAAVDARDVFQCTPLYQAAEYGHFELVRLLVNHGAAVDTCDDDGVTALHQAALRRNAEIVCFLLDRGAAIDPRDKANDTPLFYAVHHVFVQAVRVLVERGAAIDGRYIYVAAEAQHVEITRLLLEGGGAVDFLNKIGRTALHIAAQGGSEPRTARGGNVEIVCLILDHGAAVNARDTYGQTPLHAHAAAQESNVAIARLLLERGAAVDACTRDGRTPLHLAVLKNHIEATRVFLEAGAAIDARDQNGLTPLHCAPHSEIVLLLLEHGAAIHDRANDDRTPLHVAAQDGSVNVVHFLLGRGAAVDARTRDGRTPLHLAALRCDVEIERLLLEAGAAVDACARDGWTPLHYAAQTHEDKTVRLLLKKGAAADAQANDNRTPLHIAVRHSVDLDVVHMLLEPGPAIDAREDDTMVYYGGVGCPRVNFNLLFANDEQTVRAWAALRAAAASNTARKMAAILPARGADIERRNGSGQTALMFAASEGRVALVRFLIDHGASLTPRDQLGFTALDYAAAGGHAPVVRILLEFGASHGSCVCIAERASKVDAVRPVTRTWRSGEAQDVVDLLRGVRPAPARGDAALRRLRKYRSFGSWGDTWKGIAEAGHASADASREDLWS